MGQKIHPIGFRIGITKKYQSIWFARFSKSKYSQTILEDQMLRKTLTKILNDLFLNEESLNKTKNRSKFKSKQKKPTITSITIERKFIPYQIIIGIYATRCLLFKKKLIQLPFNSEFKSKLFNNEFKSKIKTTFSFLKIVKRTVKGFKITRTKKKTKKINKKQKRFNKRKKILAIYNAKIAKYFRIKKKKRKYGNQIIQIRSNLRRKINLKGLININKKIIPNKIMLRRPNKINRLNKNMIRRPNRINRLNKNMIRRPNKINQKNRIKKNKINKRIKRLRLFTIRRKIFSPFPTPKGNKVMKIILGKKLYLSKNKKQLNIKLFKKENNSLRNYLKNSHKKKFNNSSVVFKSYLKTTMKNILNLRKKSFKKILKKKLFKNKLRSLDKFKNYPVLYYRRRYRNTKKKLKVDFFKKKNKIVKLKKNFSLRMKKKFIKIFLNKIHNKFTIQLKENYYGWYDEMIKNKNLSPFSFLKKWRLAKSPIFFIFLKTLKTLSERKQLSLKQEDLINLSRQLNTIKFFLVPLKKLLIILKKKIRFKFKSLKKEFIAFGTISKVQGFAFYQVLYYFNHLQKIVNEFTKIINRQLTISKFDKNNNIDKYIKNIILPFVKNKKQSNPLLKKTVTSIKNKKQSNRHKIDSTSSKNKTILNNPLNSSVKNKLLLILKKLTKKQPDFKSLLKKFRKKKQEFQSYNQIFTHLKKIQQKKSNKKQTKLDIKKIQEKNSRKMEVNRRMEARLRLQTSRQLKAKKKAKNVKIYFTTYIKDIIKKHRVKNLYFYLPIIVEACQKIRKNNTLLQKHAKKFFGPVFGPKLNSLIKKNIATKKEFKPMFPNSDKINEIKNKLTPCIENFLTQSYHLKLQRKETANLFKLKAILVEQMRLRATLQFKSQVKIKFFYINKKDFLSKASTISQSIVDGLETRKSFRGIIKKAQNNLMKVDNRVKGIKIQVAGRLNGAEIARTEWIRVGRVPLQTLSSNIDYSYRTASTIYGIIGVKVWIFKGYTKLLNY